MKIYKFDVFILVSIILFLTVSLYFGLNYNGNFREKCSSEGGIILKAYNNGPNRSYICAKIEEIKL